uniref:Neuronal acetylcholine receptor subunit alpha-7 n=1 Tax=Schistosoma mansoni TaxID=6183 RepID=A0A5K4F9M3_SCHMA
MGLFKTILSSHKPKQKHLTINQQYSRSFYKLSLINNTNNHLNKIDSSYSNLNLNWEFKQNQITTDWAEKRLIKDLLYDYEKQSRPVVDNLTPKIYVTNTQITQQITKWTDHNLIWNPNEYGGIDSVTIPVEYLWIPDISLYNYADERLNERRPCDARIFSDGSVLWNPMGIFKSTCSVDIKYFPFDRQKCVLKFGPWSYDGFRVNISFYDGERNFRLLNYITNPEWNLLNSSAVFTEFSYPCCPEKYPDITFHVWIKRKSAFYTYILIIPSILLSSLTSVIFWLPPPSPAKIVLAMNVFVAFLLLHLLLEDTTPAAASNFPLLGAYYCFNMGVITISMFLCCITVNIHFRTAETEQPSKWLRKFTAFMGRILFINIDALELVETKDNLEMNLCLNRSAQKSVKMSSHLGNSSRQFNHSNIYTHHSLNDLNENVSSLVPKSSSSTSTSSSLAHDYLHNNTLQNDYVNFASQCPHCTIQLNTSKSYPLHSECYKSFNDKTNNNNLNKSHDSFQLPICSETNTHCSCYYFKQISSPLCYLSTNDLSNDQNRIHNNNNNNNDISSNTIELSNSHYSLPRNICLNDPMIRRQQHYLNKNLIQNINDLNNWNNQYYLHHSNHHLNQTIPIFKQKYNEHKKLKEFSKSLYWNKFKKQNKYNKFVSKSNNTQLKDYFPLHLNKKISIINQKDQQSLKYIKQDINYISKAARQLIIELKQREYKEKIIEQWKIVGILLPSAL